MICRVYPTATRHGANVYEKNVHRCPKLSRRILHSALLAHRPGDSTYLDVSVDAVQAIRALLFGDAGGVAPFVTEGTWSPRDFAGSATILSAGGATRLTRMSKSKKGATQLESTPSSSAR